jgi:hypothetical protein
MMDISWLAEKLLAAKEKLYAMELGGGQTQYSWVCFKRNDQPILMKTAPSGGVYPVIKSEALSWGHTYNQTHIRAGESEGSFGPSPWGRGTRNILSF